MLASWNGSIVEPVVFALAEHVPERPLHVTERQHRREVGRKERRAGPERVLQCDLHTTRELAGLRARAEHLEMAMGVRPAEREQHEWPRHREHRSGEESPRFRRGGEVSIALEAKGDVEAEGDRHGAPAMPALVSRAGRRPARRRA